MNNKLKNEVLIEGYVIEKNLENNNFLLKNSDDIYEFKFDDDFNINNLIDLSESEVIRVKGSFDKNDDGLFLKALGILILQDRNGGK